MIEDSVLLRPSTSNVTFQSVFLCIQDAEFLHLVLYQAGSLDVTTPDPSDVVKLKGLAVVTECVPSTGIAGRQNSMLEGTSVVEGYAGSPFRYKVVIWKGARFFSLPSIKITPQGRNNHDHARFHHWQFDCSPTLRTRSVLTGFVSDFNSCRGQNILHTASTAGYL